MPASTFSYAQAAKGLGTTAPSSRAAVAPSASSIPPVKDLANGQSNDASSNASTKVSEPSQASHDSTEKSAIASQPSLAVLPEKPTQDASSGSTSPPSIDLIQSSVSTLTREDDSSSLPAASSESTWENVSTASASLEKAKDSAEQSVDKDTNNGKDETDSNASVPAPSTRTQVEAPIPIVNIWKQRMEHAAKAAPVQIKKLANANGAPSATTAHSRTGTANGPSERRAEPAKPYRGKEIKRDPRSEQDSKIRNDTSRSPHQLPKIQPPSLQDEALWPTPELAQEEDRKKPVDKDDKQELVKTSVKKSEWKKVEVPHNVIFQTPLPNSHPRKGGRIGGRGGRDAAGGRPSPTARTTKSPTQQPAVMSIASESHVAETSFDADAASHAQTCFASDDGPGRRSSVSNKEYVPRDISRKENKTNQSSDMDGSLQQPQSPAAQHIAASKSGLGINVEGSSAEASQDRFTNGYAKASAPTRSNGKASQEHFDGARGSFDDPSSHKPSMRSNHTSNGGRRGSVRGRGGYQNFASHHSPSAAWAGSPSHQFAKSPANMQDSYWGANQNSRGFRTPRGQNAASFSNGYSSSGVMSPINAYPARSPFEQHMSGPGGMPYNPMGDQYNLISMVSMQLEYYFSLENLLRDVYLRKHMDSQGFILLDIIAGFNRLKTLTQDLEVLKIVCQQSPNIEYRLGTDGKSRVRKFEGWEQWVLEKSQRMPNAQHDGVDAVHLVPEGYAGMSDQIYYNSARHSSLPQPLSSPQYTQYMGNQQYQQQYFGAAAGAMHQFQSSPPFFNQPFASNRTVEHHRSHSGANGYGTPAVSGFDQHADIVSDAQVENLVIMTRGPVEGEYNKPEITTPAADEPVTSSDATHHAADGSLATHESDEPAESSLIEQETGLLPRRSSRSGASDAPSLSNGSSITLGHDNVSDVAHDCRYTATHQIRPERYVDVRSNALDQRSLRASSGHYPYDMIVLYQFWSHYLVKHFNRRMFEEFQALAEEDLQDYDNNVGMQHLVMYYKSALLRQEPMPPIVAARMVHLAECAIEADARSHMVLQLLVAVVQSSHATPTDNITQIRELASSKLGSVLSDAQAA